MRVLSLCDGISEGKIAFDELGIDCQYWAVEIDAFARKISDHNLPGIIRPLHDVTQITSKHVLHDWPTFDLVIFGSPCQSLSSAGGCKGLKGKSELFLDCMEVLALCKYRNPSVLFLIENVASMKNSDRDIITKMVGANLYEIDSACFSAQSRKRYYWLNWPVHFLEKKLKIAYKKAPLLNDILEDDYFSDREKAYCIDANYSKGGGLSYYIGGHGRRQLAFAWSKSARKDGSFDERLRDDGKAQAVLASGASCDSCNFVTDEDLSWFKARKVFSRHELLLYQIKYRKLTVRETARCQTIPEWFDFSVVSKTQAYKAIGNGWTIGAVKFLLGHALCELSNNATNNEQFGTTLSSGVVNE